MADGDSLLIARNNEGTHTTTLKKTGAGAGYDFPALSVLNASGDAAIEAVSSGSIAATSIGLKATSAKGRGLVGRGATGVEAVGLTIGIDAKSTDGTAVLAKSSTGLAGHFRGPVLVVGSLSVTGTKSAAVPHKDGTHRLLYAIESPDNWFEDFGAGRLSKGRASIKLDKDFAGVVDAADYHVFLTPRGDCEGLYLHAASASGFEVRECRAGKSNTAFSYRVVARRKDVKATRFSKLKVPKVDD